MRGYLCPPQDGDYTFWIASDDNGELWLSTTDSPADKVLIARVPEWTPSREWEWYTSQESEPIALLGGERYYIEALQKDGEGGDTLAVAWEGPGITQEVIPGAYLVPFDGPAPTATPAGTPTATATPTQTPTPTATPTVTPTPTCVDPYEMDNTAAQAKPFTVGSTQTHAFCAAFDRDWVAFQASAGKTYTFETLNLASGVDTFLALYSTDQTTQLYNNDDLDGTTLRSYFSYTITTSGTYYVRVQQTNNGGNPAYSYDLRIGRPCNDDYEPNNTAAQATAFTVGETQTQIVCKPAATIDVDWVVFTTTVTQTYQIETHSTASSLSLSLSLYQSDGTTLIDSVTSVSNARAVLTVELPIGTYFVLAGTFIGFRGTPYTIHIAPYLREVPHLTMTPTLPPGPTPTATPTPAPAAIATEIAIREQVNQQRLNAGLAPLADHQSLDDAARAHSQDMAANGFLGHTGSDGSQPLDRAQRAGYSGTYVGENVAGGSVPFDPVALWMTSSSHRQNILRPQYREFGAGTVGNTSTNVFANRTNVYPVFINNGAAVTNAREVTLTLTIDEDQPAGWEVQISDRLDFAGATWQPYPVVQALIADSAGPITYTVPLTVSWTLPAGVGERAVFVKYRWPTDEQSISRATIWLAAPPLTDTLTMPALPPAMQYFQSAQAVGAATFDYPLAVAGGLLPPALALHNNSFAADEGRDRPSGVLGLGTTLAEYAILRRPDATPADTGDDSFVLLWDGVLTPLVAAGNDRYLREREVVGQSFTIQLHSGAAHAIDGGTYWVITDTQGLIWRLGATSDSAWRYRDAVGEAHTWRWNLDHVQDVHTNYQTWSYLTEAASLSGQPFERGGYLSAVAWNGNSALGRAPDRRLTFSYVARGTTTEPEYDPLTTRFYLTERLDRVAFEVSQQTLWDYTFDYELAVDRTRASLLLRAITRHAADGTTVLNTTDLTYQSPFDEGEGLHLGGVTVNGTPQVGYDYETFSFRGVTRYRLSSVESHPDAPAATTTQWTLRPAVWLSSGCENTIRSFGYGAAAGDPNGSSFWSFSSTTIDNCRGDSYEYRFRTVPPFQGITYKEFCQTIDPGGGSARQRLRLLWVAFVSLPRRQATSGSGVVCHEQARNFDAAGMVGGTTRLQVGAVFDDVRQDDGGYQHLQTSYTYTASGQPRYIDQFGAQETPADDRYIERDYWLAAFPELLTRERVRDTNGAVLAEMTYQYIPGTRLLAARSRRLLEEQRVLTTSYGYDARGLLVRVTDPLGHSTRYGYDAAGNQTVITDTLGFTTHLTYDEAGRLLTRTDARGAITRYGYDRLGRMVVMTDTLGFETLYQYDARGRKIAETNPRGATTSYAYNSLDQLIVMTDTLGFATHEEYDEQGRQTATIDALGHRTTQTYEAAHGWLVASSDPLGATTSYTYDGLGRATLVTDPRGGARATEYDAFGQPIAVTDALGNQQTSTYDGLGRPVWRTDALGHGTSTVYDSLSRVILITDTLGYTTTFQYDDASRRIAVTDARGNTTRSTYDAGGRLIATTDALSQTTHYGYDALAGRLIATTDALGHSTRYGYDAVGNQTIITDTRGFATHFSYDANRRLIAVTDPLTQTIQYGYDAVGNQTVITNTAGLTTTMSYDLAGRATSSADALNRITHLEYDPLGHLIRRTGPDGVVTRYEYNAGGRLIGVTENKDAGEPADAQTNVQTSLSYDANGNLLSVTDANGHTQRTSYDALNRPISLSDPLSNTQQLFYTPRGELDYTIDALGQQVDYSYDAAGWLTAIDYPSGTPDVSYFYDAAGNVISMTDGLGVTTYTYDALQRLHTRTRDGRTVTYSYAPTGQVQQIEDWTGGSISYNLDAAGRTNRVTLWGGQQLDYNYDTAGRLATIARPNDISSSYTYDAADQLRRIEHQRSGGSPLTLQDIHYTLDLNGNRTALRDLAGTTAVTTTFQYDPLQRLIQAGYGALPGGTAAYTIPYSLDAAGNRQSDGTSSFSYNATDQIANTDYIYDANGNLLSDGTTSYQYDAANRLTLSVTAEVTTTYGYDGWGNLVRETRNGVTTDFVLDEAGGLVRILGSVRSDGVQELYAYGPEGLAAQRAIVSSTPQPILYPLLDGQASVRHLSDASGNVVLSRRYDAWGALQQSSGSATTLPGYTGELQSGNLVYLRARWYNSTHGTFTSRDSFPGVPTRPQSLHRYTYTENNPVNRTDPSGHLTDAPPCNLLPNRPDTCTWEDIQRWWESEDGERARQARAAAARTPYDGIVGFWDFVGQLGSDPRGAINGVLYGMLNSPYQIGGDLLAGTMCGKGVVNHALIQSIPGYKRG